MNKLVITALVCLGLTGNVFAAGDPAAGKQKAASCAACHGPDGNSSNPIWPKLAGQHAPYLEKQLADFKEGVRKDPTMNGMAAPLSETDMADLAAYFATQEVAIAVADEAKAAVGEEIYRAGVANKKISACMACHGPNGAGNAAAKYPALQGQHTDYVIKALKDFRTGARTNDPNKMMREIAARMNDSEIQAVAEYISGLH